MLKSDLRVKHLNKRKELSVEERDRFSTLIFNRLIRFAQAYQRIGVYISMDYEVDTHQFIQWCFSQNKQVYVPKIVEKSMVFIEIQTIDECIRNKMGILEPVSNLKTDEEIELMIVPMLAYNEKNYRLGYGKGYYDQTLSNYDGYALGICFSCNLDNELIEEEHDIKLAQIFTELE